MFVDPEGHGTAFGQLIIFLTIVFKSLMDWNNARQVRKDKQAEEAAAERRRIALAAKVEEENKKTRDAIADSLTRVRKRLNGLLQPDDDPHEAQTSGSERMETLAPKSKPVMVAGHELKRRIINYMKRSLDEYYARWPERAVDERGHDNTEKAVRDVEAIMHILDDYEIKAKK